mgnify:CR=1 FL=1
MKLKRKNHLFKKKHTIYFLFFFLIFSNRNFVLNAEDSSVLRELEAGTNTKSGYDTNLDIPTNPFEIVEMIRRANSMNDATSPTDAIDNALKSFDMIKDNKEK